MSSIFGSRNSTNSAYSAQLCIVTQLSVGNPTTAQTTTGAWQILKLSFKIGLGMSLNSPNKSFPTLGNMHWTCANINVPCQINQIKQAHWRQALRNQEVLCIQATAWKKQHLCVTTHSEFNFSNESYVCSDLWCMLSMSSRASPFYSVFQNHLFFSIAPQRRLQTFCRTTCREAFSLLLCVYWWWARWNLWPWWCLPGGRGRMNSGCEAGWLLSRFK